jgi:hypothetical protein
VLWEKTGVLPGTQVFGDDQHVYLINVATDSQGGTSSAVRALDGVPVSVPRFVEAFRHKTRILGRNLLVQETDPENRVALHLYDVHTGQDLWKQTYPAKSTVLKTEDPLLTGVVDPTGTVTVVDLRARKEVAKLSVNPEYLVKLEDASLLRDSDQYLLALNQPIDPQNAPFGPPVANVTWGMRSMRVNGWLYCFDRVTGKAKWWYEEKNQMLVLDQFENLPIVLMTSRLNQPNVGGGGIRVGGANQVVLIRVREKGTGKLVLDESQPPGNNQPFHALYMNPKDRSIELVSVTHKIKFAMQEAGEKGAAVAPAGAATALINQYDKNVRK